MDQQELGANDYWSGQNVSRVLGILQQTTPNAILAGIDGQDAGEIRSRYVQMWLPECMTLVKGVLQVGQALNMDSIRMIQERDHANGQTAPQDDQRAAGLRYPLGPSVDRPTVALPGGSASGGAPQS